MNFERCSLHTERVESLEQLELEFFRKGVFSNLWSDCFLGFFNPLLFTLVYLIIGLELIEIAVFSNIFAFVLRSILIVRIRNAFEYEKIRKSYIASGAVILLWGMYALYASGYSFFVIFLLCVFIPGLLAYYFRESFVDVQAVYLVYSGYNVSLFFLFFLFFAFQSVASIMYFLLHCFALCWLIYALAAAEKFHKQGDKQKLRNWDLDRSISRTKSFAFFTAAHASGVITIMAGIPKESAAFFDARFMFYTVMVCFLVEDFLFRLYRKVWNKLIERKLAVSGRVIY